MGGRVPDVMLHVPYNSDFACRLDQVVFTGLYFDEQIVVGYSKADYPDKPPVPAYFRYGTVGIENDSIADFFLSWLLGSETIANIHRYPSTLAAMAASEVKGVKGPRAQVEFGLTEAGAAHEPDRTILATHLAQLARTAAFRSARDPVTAPVHPANRHHRAQGADIAAKAFEAEHAQHPQPDGGKGGKSGQPVQAQTQHGQKPPRNTASTTRSFQRFAIASRQAGRVATVPGRRNRCRPNGLSG